MCGRFTLRTPAKDLAEIFRLADIPDLRPGYNISPSQPVATVRPSPNDGHHELVMLHRGLIPFWADDPKVGYSTINLQFQATRRRDYVHRTIIWLFASSAWGAGLWGALQLQRLPTSAFGAHGVCGPWGCGPPVPVLLACHAFWLVLLGPSALFAAFRLPSRSVCLLGILLVVLGVAGLLAVGAWEATTWFRQAAEWQRQFVVHRYFFALVTLVDFPILEVLIMGSGLWLVKQGRSVRSLDTVPAPNRKPMVEPS